MAQNIVYKIGPFIVFKGRRSYVVYNTSKEFQQGHTHLYKLKSAKSAARIANNKKVPTRSGLYFLTSLQRISNDKEYIERLENKKQEIIANANIKEVGKNEDEDCVL